MILFNIFQIQCATKYKFFTIISIEDTLRILYHEYAHKKQINRYKNVENI